MKKVVVLLLSLLFCGNNVANEYLRKKKAGRLKLNAMKQGERVAQNSGKAYYDSLIEKASKRHWAIQTSFYFTTEDGAFNCDGSSVPLCGLIFGKECVAIRDIYLFSRLSDCNKVRINNCDALACERGGVPIGGVGVPFGGFRDDLYTTLLAPVQLDFGTSQKEYTILLSALRRFDIGDSDRLTISVGCTVPIVYKQHMLDLNFKCGELFRVGFIPDTTQRETSLRQFFREYSSLTDFINRAVLQDKGIECIANQSKTGFGDISFFGSLEYHNTHVFEAGVAVVFPVAGKGSGKTLWEPILGNGGAYQLNPFAQALFYTGVPYVNPFVRIAGEISAQFTTDTSRVPTLVTNTSRTMVKNVEGLTAPNTFQNFYVDAFSEFDSCIPLFAAKTPCVEKKGGSKVLLGIGNYAYRLFNVDLRWGLFYDLYHKGRDSFCAKKGCSCGCELETIDCDSLEACSEQTSHAISTNVTYKCSNLFELGAGGSFTVLGKNVPRSRSFYCSVVIVF